MSSIDMTQLLNRLRMTAALAEGRSSEAVDQTQRADFSALMKKALEQVNEAQGKASELSARFDAGDRTMALEDVMIAREKASIAFQATMQVRNKLISAYQEVMSMQI